jgi:phage terminase large subunit-like protein
MILTKEIKKSVAYNYALNVSENKIAVGILIKLQVKRFFSWIETAEIDGYYLDHKKGCQAVNFFPTCLRHTKGKLAGKKFDLADFQQFTIYNLFAWINKKTGLRRINTVYDKRAKKNGKSAEMAGLCLFGMSFDNESGAEIYIGATKEDQAKICWQQAVDYIDHPVHGSPYLTAIGFRNLQNKILFDPLKSIMRPLGGDSKTQDGINSHISIIDEYHGHKDDGVKENLESSSVQRSQPITYHITTAGFNISGVCKNYEDTCVEILQGIKTDNSLWIMIHDLDPGDDWQDSKNWFKSNPLLGQGLTVESLKKEFTKAINQPSKIPNFKTKHLNMWVDAPDVWISDESWCKNLEKVKLSNFLKYGCAGAIDLSTNIDLTASAFITNPDDKGFRDLIVLSYCPLETIEKRSREDRVPYRFFKDLEYKNFIDFSDTNIKTLPCSVNGTMKILTATPGNIIDYTIVEDHTKKYYDLLRAKWIEYDRKFSDMLVHNFEESGMQMHPFSQTIGMYSFPTKDFESLILSGKIRHGGNPLLRWCVSGAVPIYDTNENVRISKAHSTKRIDPIIAAIMAHAGTLTIDDIDKSKYEDPNTPIYF